MIQTLAYDDFIDVTPSDSVSQGPFAGVYTGSGGSISLVTMQGQTRVFANLAAGTVLPSACLRVNATGTTATGIKGGITAAFHPHVNR